MIYLDHAATTPPAPEVIEAVARCMGGAWHNPSAPYAAAAQARRTLQDARRQVARMLNADPQEVLFTSGGSEGNSHAMTIAAGGHAVIGATEHASVTSAAKYLNVEVTLVPPDGDGRIPPEAVAAALRPDTRLISVQFANNETGVLQPVREIGALARARRVPFHCDAVQAFGHVPVDVKACRIDLLTLSAHKFYGPRGIGCLYARMGLPLRPLIAGGGQEFGLRGGTENVPAAAGLAMAAALADADMSARAARERALLQGFTERLAGMIPEARILGGPRLPGIVAVLLPGLPSERAIAALDLMGIQVSGGAACASRGREVSHVYRAMGLSESDARCVLRVSIGRTTTEAELASAVRAMGALWGERRMILTGRE